MVLLLRPSRKVERSQAVTEGETDGGAASVVVLSAKSVSPSWMLEGRGSGTQGAWRDTVVCGGWLCGGGDEVVSGLIYRRMDEQTDERMGTC